eukprot:scaffold21992_cov100-Phaeocystis_antarctica.AAC.7
MTKSRLGRGEGGHHLQFAAADRFSVRSKLRDTKPPGPLFGPTVELEGRRSLGRRSGRPRLALAPSQTTAHMHRHHEATMGLAGASLGRELRALEL